MSRQQTMLAWTSGFGCLVLAWGITFVTPSPEAGLEPFVVTAEIGQESLGRDIAATVTDVRAATTVTAPHGWFAEGAWPGFDLEVSARDRASGSLTTALLRVGDRLYRASERPPSLLGQALLVDLPKAGSIAFELPPDAFSAGEGAVLILAREADMRADSVIELAVSLHEVTLAPATEMLPTEWATQ